MNFVKNFFEPSLTKRVSYLVLNFCLILSLSGCEDVVQIDTPTEEPRLIVDAIIRVDANATIMNVKVKVALTGSFFGTVPVTNLEQITITNVDQSTNMGENILVLKEKTPGSGIYEELTGVDFLTDGELILQIRHNDRLYFATTRFVPSVPINSVTQGTETLFDEDDIELIVSFNDDPNRDDFYLFDFDFDEFLVTEDKFYQGQQFEFSYFYNTPPISGQVAEISLMGVDKQLFDYMDQIIDQSGEVAGPFSTPVATVKGNVFDVTDIDNTDVLDNVDQPEIFPLGYFAVVQTFKRSFVFQ